MRGSLPDRAASHRGTLPIKIWPMPPARSFAEIERRLAVLAQVLSS